MTKLDKIMARKEETMTEKKTFKLFGAPWYITLIACALILVTMYTGALGTDMPSTVALMLAIGLPFYELGKRIPIWNTYIGGGILLAFLGAAFVNYWNLIPEDYVKSIDAFTGKVNFLTLFIIVLITGSVLSLNRKILLRSFVGYVPAIFGGVAGAAILGILGGLLFSVSPARIITHYVLPIMGGGNGGGAVPLSEIFEKVTGQDKSVYYNFAIIILTIGNIYAIITAALLNSIGKAKPALTGDKNTLIRGEESDGLKQAEEEYTPSVADIGAGFLVSLAAYSFGLLMGKVVLPEIGGVKIHSLAYMIIFVVILSATGAIPERVRMGAKRMQSFFTKVCTVMIMVGVGMDLSIAELVDAMTSLPNIIIPLFIVVGAIIGSAVLGWLVGFYPIDTAVTAGLCMANRGGSGDLAVLGSADRMGLMAYAQLSSRLGGGLILIIGSICFGFLL